MKNKLETNINGLIMKNPVMTGSGTFGFGKEYEDYFDPNLLGATVLKGLTLEKRNGNGVGRLAETPAGILNCIGLENPGVELFKEKYLNELKELKVPLIANINGKTVDDYVEITKALNDVEEIKYYEVNISCPNVKDGGMAFGANPKIAGLVTEKVKAVTKKPIMLKLSPNVTDIVEIAKIVEKEGADSISLINTLLGMAIDIKKRKPILSNIFGGLSGPAVKPVALRMVWQVSQNVNIPIVGMGGISNLEDVIEFILAGATAISIGTANFIDPMTCPKIIEGLEKYCEEHYIEKISDLIGAAWKK